MSDDDDEKVVIETYDKKLVVMEFLMTYGWAIFVVLVAFGALAYFGVLSPSRYLSDVCCETYGYDQSGEKIVNDIGWKNVSDCDVSDDGVGTGKNVIDDSFCEGG